MAHTLVGQINNTIGNKVSSRDKVNPPSSSNNGFISQVKQDASLPTYNPVPTYDDYYGSAGYSTPSYSYSYSQPADTGPTDAEKTAAEHQTQLSQQNIRDVKDQLARQLSNFDLADAQNRALADTQLNQNSRKMSADRFEAQRDLRDAALGLLGSMGQAMNGSSTGNLMRMLQSRNDKENNTFWAQHQVNQDAVGNEYNDSLNQNNVARRDAMQSAEKAIRDIKTDWSANMGNINPDFFKMGIPGDDKNLAAGTAWMPDKAKQNNATISGYLIPDNRGMGTTVHNTPMYAQAMNTGTARDRMAGTDYFSRLMNRFNGR